jgi:crotonobetaine/carnitine-CoA ligase
MTFTPEAVEQAQVHGQDIGWLLSYWARKRPDHPALVWVAREGGERQWSYSQLQEVVWRTAGGLAARGITKGDKVLIHADNSPEFVFAWLACSVLGAVGVTTNTRSVAEEIRFFIDKAGCGAAITQPQYAALVAEAGASLKWMAVTADDSGEPPAAGTDGHGGDRFDDLTGHHEPWGGRAIEPMLPFGIMFTSGTTNKPKAVVHTHANAIWASRLGPRNIDLGSDDRYLIFLPFFHVNAQCWSFFSVLGVGATAVLMPKWSTSRFWDVVARQRITHISLMPFCLPAFAAPERPENQLRIGVFGLLMPDWDAKFRINVYAAYGMTETVTHAINGRPCEALEPGSMGRVAPGYEMVVVDPATGKLCGEGDTGELWLRGTRGVQLFLEYFDNPEANEKSFQDGWFRTGDMVMPGPGGNVFYRERDKDLLKVGGENVSAKEVEESIMRVPGVAQVAVVGKQHEWLNQVAVAFVVKAPGAPDDSTLEKHVIDACAQRLADFKVPRAVYVVDSFPLGTLDKILKNKLREMADRRPPV